MIRSSCLRPNNGSPCPKGGKAGDKLRSAYYSHRNALGLHWTDSGEWALSLRLSSLCWNLASVQNSSPLYVAHVSDVVWTERVWNAIIFLNRQHQIHGLYIPRQRGAVSLAQLPVRATSLFKPYWAPIDLRGLDRCKQYGGITPSCPLPYCRCLSSQTSSAYATGWLAFRLAAVMFMSPGWRPRIWEETIINLTALYPYF
jgi:hypothetical protein